MGQRWKWPIRHRAILGQIHTYYSEQELERLCHKGILTTLGLVYCYDNGTWTQKTGFGTGFNLVVSTLSSKDGNMTCALLADGKVDCFGSGSALGSTLNSSTAPIEVPGISGATQISAANDHACAIIAHKLYCWGENTTGQLGNNNLVRANYPEMVIEPATLYSPNLRLTKVAAGGTHTCGIFGGGVRCWGHNFFGELGDGTFQGSLTPKQVLGISAGAQEIAAGDSHTCAIINGNVKCWGQNFYGQLGNSSNVNSNTPVAVG